MCLSNNKIRKTAVINWDKITPPGTPVPQQSRKQMFSTHYACTTMEIASSTITILKDDSS